MRKLFNDNLVDLRKDIVIVDVDEKAQVTPISGYSCRVCNQQLFKLPEGNMWQCQGCNTQYPDALYSKKDPDAITTSIGDSEIDSSSADLLVVDPYQLYKQTHLTPEEAKRKYKEAIFGKVPHAKITREEFS